MKESSKIDYTNTWFPCRRRLCCWLLSLCAQFGLCASLAATPGVLDKQGKLWVGTVNGLQRLRADGKSFEGIAADPNDPASLAGQNIQTLFEAQDGKLWLGTAKHGAAWVQPDTLQLHRLTVEPNGNDRLSLGHAWIKRIAQPHAQTLDIPLYPQRTSI